MSILERISRDGEAHPASPPEPGRPANARAFCLRILASGDLASKLAPPFDEAGEFLALDPSGPAIFVELPARDAGLRMRSGGDKLPRPGELAALASRQLCLARFAHHELMAVEYFAWALLRWPELPLPLRRGLLAALADEQRHCRLYLDRLAALGGRFDGDDHSDYFWRQAPAIAASPAGPAAFLAAMGLTLEQANLDFTLTYRDGFAVAGDHESAAICQQVHDDEIAHVALAARWLVRLGSESTASPTSPALHSSARDLDYYLASVPFPLGASRAKGRRFEAKPRTRAGLSDAFIEHVRQARSSQERGRPWILPNLGAEEGLDWRAYPSEPHARVAARLFALLFPKSARVAHHHAGGGWRSESAAADWPGALGPPPESAVLPWLDTTPDAFAWINTQSLADALAPGLPGQHQVALAGPNPDCVHALHDKAFAVEASRTLGLHPPELDPLILVLSPEELGRADETLARLDHALETWPAWTGRRFTLKPRFGSSGRGRVGGVGQVDSPAVRGALARLARRGGAVFEPWLARSVDLSVVLHLPGANTAPSILATFELLTTRSGVFRGHCGELDAEGGVVSGDLDDDRLRAGAASIARRAAERGFSGACGVDAFRYRTGDGNREEWRGAVEWNARPTMGLVTYGLILRALPRLGEPLAATRREPLAFLFTLLDERADEQRTAILEQAGRDAQLIELAARPTPDEPRPLLFFGRDRKALREAHRSVVGC